MNTSILYSHLHQKQIKSELDSFFLNIAGSVDNKINKLSSFSPQGVLLCIQFRYAGMAHPIFVNVGTLFWSVDNVHSLWSEYKAYIRGALIKLEAQEKHKRTKLVTELNLSICKLEDQNKPQHTFDRARQ